MIRCQSCSWTGSPDDLRPSWPVTSTTIDEPYGMCPCCGGGDFDDVYICDDCGAVFDAPESLDDDGRCGECAMKEDG